MTGDGTLMTPSREVTGSVIRMLSTTCARKHLRPFWNLNHTVFLSQEQRRVKFTRGPSVDNPENTVKVTLIDIQSRHTELVLWLTELVMPCCIPYSVDPSHTTVPSSSNISLLTSLWTTMVSAEESQS